MLLAYICCLRRLAQYHSPLMPCQHTGNESRGEKKNPENCKALLKIGQIGVGNNVKSI